MSGKIEVDKIWECDLSAESGLVLNVEIQQPAARLEVRGWATPGADRLDAIGQIMPTLCGVLTLVTRTLEEEGAARAARGEEFPEIQGELVRHESPLAVQACLKTQLRAITNAIDLLRSVTGRGGSA